MNRKVLLASLLLATAMPTIVFAQEETNLLSTRKNLLSRTYLRPSISEIYITDGHSTTEQIAAAMKQQTNEQFDINEIKTNVFSYTPKEEENIQETISVFLSQEKVGNQIIQSWFPEFVNEQEGYSFRVLEERGKYAATDNDVLRNNATARKTALNELGEQLIDRSYVKVYHIYTNDKNKVKVDTYLYKLDFNEEVRTSFYENYFTKPNGIEQANFPLVYVAETSSDATPGKNNYLAIAENAYKSINTSLAKKVADFKVQTAVFATSPIRAKIGKKENVKIDDRYDIVELVQDSEGNEVSRRKAVVRVGSYIADNRTEATGSTEDFTRFYKFVGGSVQEGMTLVHHPEVGLSISPYAQTNGFGVILEYRTKLYPGLSGYIKFDLPYGKKIVIDDKSGKAELKSGLTSIEVGKESVAFYNLGLGAIKEFNFARNLSWSVGIGGGYFGHTGDDEALGKDDKLKTYYGEALGRFGIMFSPNFQLFAQASYTYHLSVGDRNFAKEFRELDMIRPFGLGIGAKISF